MVSSEYWRLLIFLPAILNPAFESFSLAFCMMHCAYKLNTQGDNIQPWCSTPFPILNQSIFPCLILTVGSWSAHRFQERQVRWSEILISLRIFQFVVIHTIKGVSVLSETEVDFFFFFWNSLAFSIIQWMLAMWSLVPLPFKNPAWTSGSFGSHTVEA